MRILPKMSSYENWNTHGKTIGSIIWYSTVAWYSWVPNNVHCFRSEMLILEVFEFFKSISCSKVEVVICFSLNFTT